MAEKTEKKKAAKSEAPAKTAAAAPAAGATGTEGDRCQVAKCKQPVRAKGYCRKHYLGWRRGDLGKKHRYKTCSKEGCRKPGTIAGRCEEHKKGAAGAEAAA
jgi:hypothetical protein